MSEERVGPEVTTRYSCSGCKFCDSVYYDVQGDTGRNVFCTDPSIDVNKNSIGDSNYNTPSWCPYKEQSKKDHII